jgi:cell wall-associated NlpC family hydrolase
MYLGNGKVIEAPQTGGKVQIVGLRSNYVAIRRPG